MAPPIGGRMCRRRAEVGRIAVRAAAALAAVAVSTQCSTAGPAPEASPTASIPGSSTPAPVAAIRAARPATVHPVSAADLGVSWRPGCPVGPEQLRRVELTYGGFDGRPHRGELVVHEDLVEEVIAIFDALDRLHYPIERMQLPQHYPGADDELSMEDDNTSAFNCRGIPGSQRWSEHAYGRAIDINPLLNPAIHRDGWIEPITAGPYLDRTRDDAGLLHDGDAAVRVFTDRGWIWGGHWRNPKDYQHFELPAR